MNEHHALCGSEEWRTTMREQVIPWAFGVPWGADVAWDDDHRLGDDVLEVGPGYGATTDVFREAVARLTSVEIDAELAASLRDRLDGTNVDVVDGDATAMTFPDGRFTGAVCFTMLHHVPTVELQDRLFAEVARVLAPGSRFVLADSLGSDELAGFHEGDTYNPVDPDTLVERLGRAGFDDVVVRTNDHGWSAGAVRRA